MFSFFSKKKEVEESLETKADFTLKTIFGAEFGLNDLELLETIGTGTFSRIRLVRCLLDKKYYALKKMAKSAIVKHGQVVHVQNEVMILSHLRSKLVVDMVAMFQDDNNLYICLEYVPGGELFSHLRKKEHFSNDEAKFYAVEVAAALNEMHSHDIVYRDLKPENLLLSKDGHIKIVDFGFAKVVPDQTFTLCGTPEYLAPEVIDGNGYGLAVDWWALGVLLHEMLYGFPPYYASNPFKVYEKILSGTLMFPATPLTGVSAQMAMRSFLTRDRKKRAGCGRGGFKGITKLQYFKGTSWESAARLLLMPPAVPTVAIDGDTSNYDFFPEEALEEPSNLTAKQREMFQKFDEILSRPVQSI